MIASNQSSNQIGRHMAKDKITKKLVDATHPGDRDQFIWDTELRGFGLKVTRGGRKVYLIQYRMPGRTGTPTRFMIGVHGRITPDAARSDAKKYLGMVEAGNNPAETKRRAKRDITVAELCDVYLAEGITTKRASTVARDRSRIDAHIKPLLGKAQVQSLAKTDIERLQRDVARGVSARDVKTERKHGRSIVRGGEGAARECVALFSSIMGFAVGRGMRPDNPATGVKKFRQRRMQRFLSAAELATLGQALTDAESEGADPFAIAAIRLLILTGARKGEILGLQWPMVNWELAHVALPDSKTGAKEIRLGPPAMEELRDIQKRLWDGKSRFVVQGRNEDAPLAGIQKVWARVRARANLDDVRIHDLRHSFASIGAAAGDSLLVIGAVLGHQSEATTRRYAHLGNDPVRQATDRISTQIDEAMRKGTDPGAGGGEVVSMRRQ